MARKKYEDLLTSPKYQNCFGYIHVQTLTKFICSLFLLIYFYELKDYINNYQEDDSWLLLEIIFGAPEQNFWELFKIIFGILASIGPLIGIRKKKTKYFIPFFFSPLIRYFHYFLIIWGVSIAIFFPMTHIGKEINDSFTDYRSQKIERYFGNIPVKTILLTSVSLISALEIWFYYVIFKCYKYVAAVSFQDLFKEPTVLKKHGKTKNSNLQTLNDKEPLIQLATIKKYTGYAILEWFFLQMFKNPLQSIVDQPLSEPKLENVKYETEVLKPFQYLKITTNIEKKSNQVKCNSDVKLKNHTVQSEAVTMNLKSTEKIEKFIKVPRCEKPQIAESIQTIEAETTKSKPVNVQLMNYSEQAEKAMYTVELKSVEMTQNVVMKRFRDHKALEPAKSMEKKKPEECGPEGNPTVQLKSDAGEVKMIKMTLLQKSKQAECNAKIQFKNTFSQPEVMKITVALKSFEAVKKVIKLQQSLEKQNTTSKSDFHQSHYSSKQKKFVTTEVQTDQNSFDQSIIKNKSNDVECDSETNSTNPKYSTSSSPFAEASGSVSITEQKSPFSASSGIDTADLSPYQTFSPKKELTAVSFLFNDDETFAIEIYQNGRKEKIKNLFDNEWTPLYFSMATFTPEIGEKAQIHCHQFREYVLYDIFKVIGRSLNEIQIDPEWKFKVVEKDGIKCFQIKTKNGLRLFPENIIIATFLKSMKGIAENYLNSEINEIYLFSNFNFTESQKNVFKNAASKIHLKILSFHVISI